MTAAQKTARENFKKAIAYRGKTGCSLKEAFAHVKGKKISGSTDYYTRKKEGRIIKKAAKKVVRKKRPSEKSVLLSIKKAENTQKRHMGIGALPVGFSGNIWGVHFKIINQFDIYNEVAAIMEDTQTGSTIVLFDGKGSANIKAEKIEDYVIKHRTKNYSYTIAEKKDLLKRLIKFSASMQKEVIDYNKGGKKTIKKTPLNIAAPKKTAVKKTAVKKTVKKNTSTKKHKTLHYAGRTRGEDGKRAYKYVLSGVKKSFVKIGAMPTFSDYEAAREISLYADNDNDLYRQQKRPILINLSKKYKKGNYKIELAAKLWRHYIESAMKKYTKEFGGRGDKWYDILSVPDRNLLAMEYATETKEEFDLGNYTEL
jgi:hypothetical protein